MIADKDILSEPEYRKLNELREKFRTIQEEALKAQSERDELNNIVRELSLNVREKREELRELRSTLRELKDKKFSKIATLRQLRERKTQLRDRLSELRRERRRLIQERKSLIQLVGKQRLSLDELKQQFEEIEWRYQTTPLSPEEEKWYIGKLLSLEKKIYAVSKLNEISDRIDKIEKEYASLLEEYREISENLKKGYEEIQRMNEEINALIERVEGLREELSSLVSERDKMKMKADEKHKMYLELKMKAREIKQEIEKYSLLLKAKKISRLIDEQRKRMLQRAQEIYKKYERGEKLTFEELKILIDLNLI
ncbi:MAG: hypothetical protein DRJ51_02920 [Thermoprotei archaeon]|nr:MAG: hypothetical protein DRJ51_02920 [Thermoprotei archaeon]RLF02776.1 MAG: hypothetical protein DRJ59_02680 [Thermoprotei archaeon]